MSDMFKFSMLMLFGVLISDFSQILLKIAATKTYKNWVFQYLNWRVITAYFIFFTSTICTVIAYKVVPLSMSPVWTAAGQIFVTILSFVFLGEKPGKKKILGIAIIIVGLFVFSG